MSVLIPVQSPMTPSEAADKYRKTPAWDAENIRENRDRAQGSYHIGNGVWLAVCPECDAETQTHGNVMIWNGIGQHRVDEHGHAIPGLSVGILA